MQVCIRREQSRHGLERRQRIELCIAALRIRGEHNDRRRGPRMLRPPRFRLPASVIEMGFRPDVIESQLAHQERSMTRASYNRAVYLQERREMVQARADLIDFNWWSAAAS
jgi:hypothetical protein